MFDTINLETDARGVATLTLNRPDKHNAISARMIAELAQAAEQIDTNDAIRVVVLRGQGASFCAGGDLAWMREQRVAKADDRAAAARGLAGMLAALNSLSKPLLARVHGAVFGGGVGLCCICDKVLADRGAMFGLTETKLGLIPATIGPYVIARMGGGNARQVFMSSRRFDAQDALRLGVVSFVGDAEAVDTELESEIAAYLNCAPGAVAEAKAMALSIGATPTADEVEASIQALLGRWASDEAEQGLAAFFDKTAPPWA